MYNSIVYMYKYYGRTYCIIVLYRPLYMGIYMGRLRSPLKELKKYVQFFFM